MRPVLLLTALLAAAATAAPVVTGPPNNPAFRPAFAGQARAEAVRTKTRLRVTEVATGLAKPWAIAFLPDGRMLVTEKAPGALRLVTPTGTVSAPVAGLPPVDARDQGGLLGLALSPGFARDRLVYWSYSELRRGGNGLAVARARLVEGSTPRLDGVAVIFRMAPTIDSTKHSGGRMLFAPDGKLYIGLGERSILAGRVQAQDPASHFGKLVRINPDGSVPGDNPFVGRAGAKPEIWSTGHRNILGVALDARGALWEIEMGPKGGDELNRVERARDYGWPTVSYGDEYSGEPIGAGITARPGLVQPVYYWDPVISPSSLLYYTGAMFPEWRGNFLIGGLSSKALVRLVMSGDRVVGEERLLTERGERVRDVVAAPDGALWLATDDGKLLRVTARG